MTIITFHVGPILCGAEVQNVQEVLRNQEWTPIPLADAATPGLLHLRGQILTVIDLSAVFEIPRPEQRAKPVCVIVRDGESSGSLFADRVGEVLEVEESSIAEPPSHWQGPLREYLRGVADRGNQLLHLLDVTRILEIESGVSA